MESHISQYRNLIVPIILEYAPHAKIILYGSRARGDEGAGSDIDIALDCGQKIDDAVLNKIIESLEESNLPIYFDIIDFHNVSAEMQKQILNDGVVWKN